MTYCRLTAVYGLTYSDINAMPLSAIEVYVENIPRILAERRMVAADGASIPHSKNAGKIMKQWHDLAYGEGSAKQTATPAMLRFMGIGVSSKKAVQ